MRLDLFPPAFKQELDTRTEQRVLQERNRSTSQQNEIRKSSGSRPDGVTLVMGPGFIGFVVGFFICCSKCNLGYKDAEIDALITWVLWTVGGLVLGGLLYWIVNSSHERNVNDANIQVGQEAKHSEEVVNYIRASADIEYSEYVKAFEGTAQQMSVRFAESQLANEVIGWMTNGYIKTIESAKRDSHIKNVNVPFAFDVYADKIMCNLGTFDFEIKRCRRLSGPLEQTALARAIASAIQLNITMKYPKDISGSDIAINIGYRYSMDAVSATIVYLAHNNNYCPERDWN